MQGVSCAGAWSPVTAQQVLRGFRVHAEGNDQQGPVEGRLGSATKKQASKCLRMRCNSVTKTRWMKRWEPCEKTKHQTNTREARLYGPGLSRSWVL